MRSIWKFPLDITDRQPVNMPAGSDILDAQFQHGVLCVWAAVERENPVEPRTLVIVGTGNPMPDGKLQHIATVQHPDLGLVWHVFEDQTPAEVKV
ncbi:DUF7352 domain-containing protein [Amycolatopsis thermophila]|uniref:DUF7352 domain-containing protein n=1 Tax=Amycolatopsis thermophila TaxID=206084 RepID=A0ABU0EMP5_9PSEU|nr:hypothetical protein [Amycolatopsis thermophila]MDQ0376545.1 hypothetical protein [Amycolatopsis thermophila]